MSTQAFSPGKTVTALLADDEPLLLQALANRLQKLWPELAIIERCHDGQSALASIEAKQPDIAFLDIQMPFLTGMEAARRIRQLSHPPLLVFVTAHSEHALEAFDQQAIDYLLKPVSTDRLQQCLQRLQQQINARQPAPPAVAEPRLQHLNISVGQRRLLLAVTDIACFEADGKYTRVISPRGEYLLNQPLKELEQQLPEQFRRIHRGTILNLDFVDYSQRTDTGRLQVQLKGLDHPLIVSRKYLQQLG
ncbi:LytR/AlgR family response regulator transcription factor [Parathalassolituus penaei]|uniref:LytTR family DNA-binding domain-containing protein n=1 Tax=Parathalassolituus penaei TaxID=2997323 RepID=A0A9X3EBP6_9GAMM|nr:LytTR family DNA-binding domain-containing protein [Parathalassolituus penaei]MCY0963775.1 LytTR family DNA-binding domain-containing protein [Parathalassolituus penaei]